MGILSELITREDVKDAKQWLIQEIRGRREDPFEKVAQFVKDYPGPVAACATGLVAGTVTLVATASTPALLITFGTAIGAGLTAEFIKSKIYAGRR